MRSFTFKHAGNLIEGLCPKGKRSPPRQSRGIGIPNPSNAPSADGFQRGLCHSSQETCLVVATRTTPAGRLAFMLVLGAFVWLSGLDGPVSGVALGAAAS